ncbi:MAG: hypothetical protein LBG11_01040, partial [Bifidobacteriaceae bacterium]|nr:hypothetical protein [Bifidobacteriaceae bacterium]
LIAIVTIAARLMGFIRWGVFSGAVGSTATGSAYTAANALPNVLFEVAVGGILASVAVPLLAAPLAKELKGGASQTASALMTWTLTVLVPLGVALALAARPLADLVVDAAVDAAHPGTRHLAASLIAVFALQVPLYGIGVVASGVLQAAKRFFWPAAAPLASSLTVTGVYIWFARLAAGQQDSPRALSGAATAVLGWGTTAGVVMLTLPLLVPLYRTGIRLRPTYRFAPGTARRAAGLVGAGVAGLVAQQLFVLTSVMVASRFGPTGALPVFHYAQAVYLLPFAVLVAPVATAAFPHLATYEKPDSAEFKDLTARTTRIVLTVAAAGAAGLIAAAPSVERAFAAIDPGVVKGLSFTLTGLSVGLIGYGLMNHLQRVLYAAGNSGLAGGGVAAGWLTAAAVALLAVGSGASALASLGWGSAVGMTLGGVVLLVGLRRRLGSLALEGLARTALVVLTSGAAGALVGRLVTVWMTGLFPPSGASGVGALGAIGAGTVGALAGLMVIGGLVFAFDRGVIGALRERSKA